jgi:Na+/H+ antiporter NhaD/arsenite permease-like protein
VKSIIGTRRGPVLRQAVLIGASTNIVSAGICAANAKPVGFVRFMRYGVPLTLCQLAVAAAYVEALYL